MLARSCHLQGIFRLLKPFLHVQILICFVEVYQKHSVFMYLTTRSTFISSEFQVVEHISHVFPCVRTLILTQSQRWEGNICHWLHRE